MHCAGETFPEQQRELDVKEPRDLKKIEDLGSARLEKYGKNLVHVLVNKENGQ